MTLKLLDNAPLTLPGDQLAYAKDIVRAEAPLSRWLPTD